MRVKLSCNAAGDIRLQCLNDKKDISAISPPEGGALVCCSEFQEKRVKEKKPLRVGFGLISKRHAISRYARKKIRCAGALLDNGALSKCVFLTGTLPGSTIEAEMGLASQSGWVVQTVEQWIRDYAPGAQFFGVWEYQKRGALHLHVCVRVLVESEATRLITRWKDKWIAVLRGASVRSGFDLFARNAGSTWQDTPSVTRTDAQMVRYSVGRYLSKYLSKGSQRKRKRCYYPPSRWTFVSRALTRAIAEAEKSIEIEHLAPETAIDLFSRIGGQLVDSVKKSFAYELPHDCRQRGVISLAVPVQAAMLFGFLAGALRCLQGVERVRIPKDIPAMQVVANYFCGRWVRSPIAE